MQPKIAFCLRCGGMEMGWNKRFVAHKLYCKGWLHKSARLAGLAVVAVMVFGFPKPGASVGSVPALPHQEVAAVTAVQAVDAELPSMNAFLKLHQVNEANRERLAQSIVSSARKHGLNPRLLASIIVVESRGNPFAISGQDAVGIMQIHLPTWGSMADRENINLLKIEDNIDFGARIPKDYVQRFGVPEGIRRYNGLIPGEPSWEKSSQEYLDRVQQVYNFKQAPVLQASVTQ
jgi:soluble lytic murein transglycosylase-like protein